MHQTSSKLVLVIRVLVLLCGFVGWWNIKYLDHVLADYWDSLRQNWVFKLDSFEPLVVSLSFLCSMGFYYALDMLIPMAAKWRIHQTETDMRHWKIEGGGRFKNEMIWYWAPIALFDFLYPRRKLPLEAPTIASLITEIVASLIVYDIFFFCFHLLFHKVSYLYKKFHAKHHTKSIVRASETMRLSLMEEVIDVGCSIASINILRCHPLSRALYNFIIVYLITELHSGYDMPWMLQNIVPFELWGGSRRHDFHHRYGTKYYSKFFTPLDSCYHIVTNHILS